jgi:phosphoglucosamine mutase
LINVRLAPGQTWAEDARLAALRAEVEAELAGKGRILIRASGTEPVVRVMVEAQDAGQAQRSAERLALALSSH